MDLALARQQVIDAGKKLVENGLIARTWGNVSCRVDDKTFVITPSGKPYETLEPEQIVQVDIATLAYESDIKPSSEKGVHAQVYLAHPDAGFVIHTHQKYASAAACLNKGIDTIAPAFIPFTGSKVPLAAYGLPGTKKLIVGVKNALAGSDAKAVLMAHHGALCFGPGSEAAFETASKLEDLCLAHIVGRFNSLYKKNETDIDAAAAEIAAVELERILPNGDRGKVREARPGCLSHREGNAMVFIPDGEAGHSLAIDLSVVPDPGQFPYSPEAFLHAAVYRAYPHIGHIIRSTGAAATAFSTLGRELKPQVDDFAQIVGTDARCIKLDPERLAESAAQSVRALKGRSALLLEGEGVLCCALTKSDAEAIEMITQKNALAELTAMLFGCSKPINALESKLMRFIYLKKYSKQAQ